MSNQTPQLVMKTELRSTKLQTLSLSNPQDSLSGALKGCFGTLDAACIEKLLLHCASALESKDVTLAQTVMWVLNNAVSSLGDPNQRLTSCFLKALINRASMVVPISTMNNVHGSGTTQSTRSMSVTELAEYVDLTPWHRFGFSASNSAILEAIQGCPKVHILDFSITHCMQWPTLIDALSKRPQGPSSLRITVPSCRPPVPPFLNVSTEEVGLRLANFAKTRDLSFEFQVINCSSSSTLGEFLPELILSQLNPSSLKLRDDEALVVNCQNWLRYLPDESAAQDAHGVSLRDGFIEVIKGLNPCIMIAVDEDADLVSPSLCSRITACFNYLWIPFDALETFLPKDSRQRAEYEADVSHKIENIVSFEGLQRIERIESGAKLRQRMNKAHLLGVKFSEETVKEVKMLLDEHASGWGMKMEDDMLVLTWKGHNSVFATAWVPIGFVG